MLPPSNPRSQLMRTESHVVRACCKLQSRLCQVHSSRGCELNYCTGYLALLAILAAVSFTGGSGRHTLQQLLLSIQQKSRVTAFLTRILVGSQNFLTCKNSLLSNCSFASCTLGQFMTRSKYCDLRGLSNHQDLQGIGLGQNGTGNRCQRNCIDTIVTRWCDESLSQSKENVLKHLPRM